jgi:hypothetical protein
MDGSYLRQEGCTYAFDDEIAAEVEELHGIKSNRIGHISITVLPTFQVKLIRGG